MNDLEKFRALRQEACELHAEHVKYLKQAVNARMNNDPDEYKRLHALSGPLLKERIEIDKKLAVDRKALSKQHLQGITLPALQKECEDVVTDLLLLYSFSDRKEMDLKAKQFLVHYFGKDGWEYQFHALWYRPINEAAELVMSYDDNLDFKIKVLLSEDNE